MCEFNSIKQVDRSFLTNPEQGRAYLKAALKMGDEQEFLEALHAVMDSFSDSEFNSGLEVSVLPTWENAQAA